MKAMVLAAGVGSRLDPLTSQLPKPLVPVANRPVMEHLLALLKKHGFCDIVSNLHYMPEEIRQYFGDGSRFGLKIDFRYEKELSGDAGGVRACRDFFAGETFIVLMGDLLTDADLSAVLKIHKAKKALATIGLKQVEDVSQFGVALTNKDGFITGFQEKPSNEEALSNLASTGIYVFEPEIFDHMPQTGSLGFGRQLFPQLVEDGLPVLGAKIEGYWTDVGTIKQYKQSNFDALAGKLKLNIPGECNGKTYLEAGAVIAQDCQIDGQLLLGAHSQIKENVRLKGQVIIGDNCTIEPNTVLTDTIVWSNSVIGPDAYLENCVVGSKCAVANGTREKELATVTWPPKLCSVL